MDLIATLNSGDDLQLSDASIISDTLRHSLEDPLYADAMVRTIDATINGEMVDVGQFLELPVDQPSTCDARHLTTVDARKHLQQVDSIGDYVFAEASDRLGESSSELLKGLVESAKEDFEKLIGSLEPDS